MILFGVFPPILRDFDVNKVVCIRYNLDRSNYCEITTVVSVTISPLLDFAAIRNESTASAQMPLNCAFSPFVYVFSCNKVVSVR
jgi:hypothetical protein